MQHIIIDMCIHICQQLFMEIRSKNSHRLIQDVLLKRIHSGEWQPGSLIPTEVLLADEFGCARTTVNRALRQLATDGLVIRKRNSGTRVALTPIRKATLEIPIIRHDVEKRGHTYGHLILKSEQLPPPLWVQVRTNIGSDIEMLHLQTLHLSDSHPYMFEDRWVNLQEVPAIAAAPLDEISPNEWLVRKVPYSRGKISFSACLANAETAKILEITPGSAIFLVERSTWMNEVPITTLKMYYPESFKLTTEL
jgi:GntR family histidine utilization transcriptional repressor